MASRLQNPHFIEKAPQELVQAEQKLAKDLEISIEKLENRKKEIVWKRNLLSNR